jgi:hypothetical protein
VLIRDWGRAHALLVKRNQLYKTACEPRCSRLDVADYVKQSRGLEADSYSALREIWEVCYESWIFGPVAVFAGPRQLTYPKSHTKGPFNCTPVYSHISWLVPYFRVHRQKLFMHFTPTPCVLHVLILLSLPDWICTVNSYLSFVEP